MNKLYDIISMQADIILDLCYFITKKEIVIPLEIMEKIKSTREMMMKEV